MKDLKTKVDAAIEDFIGGACLSDKQIKWIVKFNEIDNGNTYEFLDIIEFVNGIRSSHSESLLRNLAACGFRYAYELANHIDRPEEEKFQLFLNCGGYPNCTVWAINAKYMVNHNEYINIHKKGFEMCAAGASNSEIAKIF